MNNNIVVNVLSIEKRAEVLASLRNIRNVFQSIFDSGIKVATYTQVKDIFDKERQEKDTQVANEIDKLFAELVVNKPINVEKIDVEKDVEFMPLELKNIMDNIDSKIKQAANSANQSPQIGAQANIKRLEAKGQRSQRPLFINTEEVA